MGQDKIIIERIPGVEQTVRIPLASFNHSQTLNADLRATFNACISNGDVKIILDLKGIRFPSASLIALLIEATSIVRDLDGDVKIINVSRSAKSNLTIFTPFSYLSLEKDEEYALRDLRLNKTSPLKAEPSAREIVEDPLIEKLNDSVEEQLVEDHDDLHYDLQEPGPHAEAEDTTAESPMDDAAKEEQNHLRVKSDPQNLYSICDFVTTFAEKAGFNAKDVGKIKIAVYEACLNTIEHAYHSRPDNWMDIWVEYDNNKFEILVQDYGISFVGPNTKDYDVLAAMDHRKTGGFGLYIIRRSMDEVDYESRGSRGNCLRMVKYLKQEKGI